ncbi:MAG TPA: hypothetical protein ENI70_01020 [Candidatus Peregrinibacteria bacterium]|nr:hypothetical protein [Candidatus Peregrinibacteria bacterium]
MSEINKPSEGTDRAPEKDIFEKLEEECGQVLAKKAVEVREEVYAFLEENEVGRDLVDAISERFPTEFWFNLFIFWVWVFKSEPEASHLDVALDHLRSLKDSFGNNVSDNTIIESVKKTMLCDLVAIHTQKSVVHGRGDLISWAKEHLKTTEVANQEGIVDESKDKEGDFWQMIEEHYGEILAEKVTEEQREVVYELFKKKGMREIVDAILKQFPNDSGKNLFFFWAWREEMSAKEAEAMGPSAADITNLPPVSITEILLNSVKPTADREGTLDNVIEPAVDGIMRAMLFEIRNIIYVREKFEKWIGCDVGETIEANAREIDAPQAEKVDNGKGWRTVIKETLGKIAKWTYRH